MRLECLKRSVLKCLFKFSNVYVLGSLEARIAEISDQGKIEEKSVKALVHSIASALKFLHAQGIAHRDIKPANILLPDPLSVRKITKNSPKIHQKFSKNFLNINLHALAL